METLCRMGLGEGCSLYRRRARAEFMGAKLTMNGKMTCKSVELIQSVAKSYCTICGVTSVHFVHR